MSDAKRLKLNGYERPARGSLRAGRCRRRAAVGRREPMTPSIAELRNRAHRKLRQLQSTLPITGPPSDSAFTIRTDGSLERNASTATPGQTYTWLPGDAWSQYCEEQP